MDTSQFRALTIHFVRDDGAQEADGIKAVHEAVKRGVNFFDVSPYYGRTLAETVLGKALRQLPRDSFVVSTKVGRYDSAKFDFSADRVKRSVDESMKRLGVSYLDIVQCHDIEFGDLDQIVKETIPALNKLKKAGKIGAVGITGYPLEIFPYVLSCVEPGSVDTVLSYCHYCLQNDRLRLLFDALKKHNVGVINASPLSMGLLTPGGPRDWHPADAETKEAARQASKLCAERGSNLASVAMQFALGVDSGFVANTLVGIDSVDTLDRNIGLMSSQPDLELIAEVQDVFRGVQNRRWSSGKFIGYQGGV